MIGMENDCFAMIDPCVFVDDDKQAYFYYGDYCRNSDYRRKNIAEKKQDSVKAYWQIRSDFVSLPL